MLKLSSQQQDVDDQTQRLFLGVIIFLLLFFFIWTDFTDETGFDDITPRIIPLPVKHPIQKQTLLAYLPVVWLSPHPVCVEQLPPCCDPSPFTVRLLGRSTSPEATVLVSFNRNYSSLKILRNSFRFLRCRFIKGQCNVRCNVIQYWMRRRTQVFTRAIRFL